MTTRDLPLWDEPTPRPKLGETRRALDRDIKRAEADGLVFLETEKASLRRQANDIDRLEALFTTGEAKPWDYNPKTQAHAAYRDALRGFFGTGDTDAADDPFVAALAQLEEEAARASAAEELDAEEPRQEQ